MKGPEKTWDTEKVSFLCSCLPRKAFLFYSDLYFLLEVKSCSEHHKADAPEWMSTATSPTVISLTPSQEVTPLPFTWLSHWHESHTRKACVTESWDLTPLATAVILSGTRGALETQTPRRCKMSQNPTKHSEGQTLEVEGVLSKHDSHEGGSSLIKPPTWSKQ